MNDRELEVLRAAERIVGLLRRAQETGGSIPQVTADLCLAAFDEAKKRGEDKTVFERVAEANEDPFADGIKEDLPPPPLPAIEIQNPLTAPIPEPRATSSSLPSLHGNRSSFEPENSSDLFVRSMRTQISLRTMS